MSKCKAFHKILLGMDSISGEIFVSSIDSFASAVAKEKLNLMARQNISDSRRQAEEDWITEQCKSGTTYHLAFERMKLISEEIEKRPGS